MARSPPLAALIRMSKRPESVAYSLDGRTLFVSNCGSGLYGSDRGKVGFLTGAGVISKLRMSPSGRAEMVRMRFIADLNGPLGLGILPKATARYPQGTLLVNVGISLQVNESGESVTDAKALGTGVLFFDPDTGARLGGIDLGPGGDRWRWKPVCHGHRHPGCPKWRRLLAEPGRVICRDNGRR